MEEHIIPSLECFDDVLDGDAATRTHPISKCYMAAKARGYTVFALQDGGCYSSKDADITYSLIGKSTACSRGRGGNRAYDVYTILAEGKNCHFFTVIPGLKMAQTFPTAKTLFFNLRKVQCRFLINVNLAVQNKNVFTLRHNGFI